MLYKCFLFAGVTRDAWTLFSFCGHIFMILYEQNKNGIKLMNTAGHGEIRSLRVVVRNKPVNTKHLYNISKMLGQR